MIPHSANPSRARDWILSSQSVRRCSGNTEAIEKAGFDAQARFEAKFEAPPAAPKPQTPRTKRVTNSKKKASIEGNLIRVDFPFDWDTMALIKSIPGRRFHGDTYPKYWTVPFKAEVAEILAKGGFQLAPEIEALIKKEEAPPVIEVEKIQDLKLKRDLFPSRRKEWSSSRTGRVEPWSEMRWVLVRRFKP